MAGVEKKLLAAAGAVGATVATAVAIDRSMQISHDMFLARRLVPALIQAKQRAKSTEASLAELWAESLARFADRTFIVFEHRRLTFKDVDRMSNQMAHWLRSQNVSPGQTVALMMENKPEFICWWLAMAKIGVKVAMINYNLTGRGLAHCIRVAECVGVVFDSETESNVHTVEAGLRDENVTCFFWGGQPRLDFTGKVATVTYDHLLGLPYGNQGFKELRKGINYTDVFGYIYTSGTTGLPKAAKMTHIKMASAPAIFAKLIAMGPEDSLYLCLPIYHTAGGTIGVFSCLMSGATLVLSRKFSASRIWTEIAEQGCTVFQYIGELGRYLVNHARANPEVKQIKHRLRAAIGNGLRPEVWDEFQDGFNIPVVLEFYGATEGNGALLNYCVQSDKQARGAVGRTGKLFRRIMGYKLVKFDIEAEVPIRGPDGFCIECSPGEPGELLFPIDMSDPTKQFVGYTDSAATEKKVIKDAFAKGDSWFRSGDLLSSDSRGYWFFVDRIGDTFRWKGENVSTMEVSEIISAFPGVEEANVYGVKVPGVQDGRGCMVALSAEPELQAEGKLKELQDLIEKELPVYARPLFIRFLPKMEITGTFKHQKVQLREEGCDPTKVTDPIFVLHPKRNRYERLTEEFFRELSGGQSKL